MHPVFGTVFVTFGGKGEPFVSRRSFLGTAATVVALAAVMISAGPVAAHFQLIHTPQFLLERGGRLVLKMPFTHPAISGYVMEMGAPQAFFVVNRGRRTDLAGSLVPISWTSAENANTAYEAEVRLRGLGDHVFVLIPAPYFEATEDAYIQQITKTIINVGSLPTDWDEPLGLPAEILPLTKPYAVYAGGTFSGVVLGGGEPVPFAEIEVEFMNFPPNLQTNAFAVEGVTTPPGEALATLSIRADASGSFTFGLPRAGHWGFAALGVGPEDSHGGKGLSQDAVLWVQAHPMR